MGENKALTLNDVVLLLEQRDNEITALRELVQENDAILGKVQGELKAFKRAASWLVVGDVTALELLEPLAKKLVEEGL